MAQNLAEEGPIQHVFEECSKNGDLKWKFLEKSKPINATISLSDKMHLFEDDNIHDILSSRYLFKSFNKEAYQELLDGLKPEHLNIYLSSQKVDTLTDKEFTVEYWYKTEYIKEKFSEDLLAKMKNPVAEAKNEFKLSNPIENTFFPNTLELLEENKEDCSTVKLVHSDDKIDVWYKKSEKFKTPKINAINLLYTNDCGNNTSVEGAAFVAVFLKSLENYFREFLYMAEMASLE